MPTQDFKGTVNLLTVAAGAANLKRFMNAAGTDQEWASGFAMGNFTYDISTTGAASITGVGFKPSAIFFMVGLDDTYNISFGFSVGDAAKCAYTNRDTSTFAFAPYAWGVAPAAGTAALSAIAMNADGFTYTKTKASSPTGTATVYFMALR